MFGIGPFELLIFVGVLLPFVAVVAVAVVLVATRPRPAPTREARLVGLTRGGGTLLGLVVAYAVAQVGSYGRGPMLAPAAFGLCVLVATALGETVVRGPRPGAVRSASLTPRRVRDHLPPVTGPLVGVAAVATVVVGALTTATASRTGGLLRALSCRTEQVAESRSPYPGAYYTVPLAGCLLLVGVVAAVAARQVVLRPRGAGVDDDGRRTRSVGVVVAATGVAVCGPLAGIAFTGGLALTQMGGASPTCAPAWMQPTGTALLLVVPLAVLLGLGCLVQLAVGPSRARARVDVAA